MTEPIALPGRDVPDALALAYLALRVREARKQYLKRHCPACHANMLRFEIDLYTAATAVVDARQEVKL